MRLQARALTRGSIAWTENAGKAPLTCNDVFISIPTLIV